MTRNNQRLAAAALAAIATVGAAACGGPDGADASSVPATCATAALSSENGITHNAISFNQISFNALTYNALTFNAISYNALASERLDAALARRARDLTCTPGTLKLLSYLVGCALAPEQHVSVRLGGARHTLSGSLGLAPRWLDAACDETCQQWVSACLIARVNARGEHVEISLRGAHPGLTLAPGEARAFPRAEASYYGNLFGDRPVTLACLADGVDRLDRVCGRAADCPVRAQGACASVCDDRGCRGPRGRVYPHVISVFRQPTRAATPVARATKELQ